ncbi:MAG: hypothetical protein EAZ42_08645 [Verrucomicrobia bacterium]|nr:MAG: hypothetical protein EAZ42_08645 [Verrucomicrobiota bacterium]
MRIKGIEDSKKGNHARSMKVDSIIIENAPPTAFVGEGAEVIAGLETNPMMKVKCMIYFPMSTHMMENHSP